jgi:ferrochelatase
MRPWSARPCFKTRDRDVRCQQCEHIAEATDWSEEEASEEPERTAAAA